jgi:hypothetical protein
VVAFHFSTGGEEIRWLSGRASDGRRMAVLASCFG